MLTIYNVIGETVDEACKVSLDLDDDETVIYAGLTNPDGEEEQFPEIAKDKFTFAVGQRAFDQLHSQGFNTLYLVDV